MILNIFYSILEKTFPYEKNIIKNYIANNSDEDLINFLVNKITFSEPQWNEISGIFLMITHKVKVEKYRNFSYDNFYNFIKEAVDKNIYTSSLLKYSFEEIKILEQNIIPDRDFLFDYAGANLLINRYTLKYKGNNYELPQEMFMIISMLLAINENNKVQCAIEFYNALSTKKLSLATPLLANLRVPNGNLSSCFISAIDDNIDSIFHNISEIAKISKNGGGVGINLSRVRGKGSVVNGYLNASGGVIPWIKIINDTAVAVNQQGRRAGAVTVALDLWHLDILNFLELQTENGDQRGKAYDIYPQVVIPDLFMNRVKNNETWTLFDPYEIRIKYNIELCELCGSNFEDFYIKLEKDSQLKLKKTINSKDLFKQIMKTQIETGMPYIFFKDTANLLNHNSHMGYIGNGNLCMESFSNFSPSKKFLQIENDDYNSLSMNTGLTHTCNLISINLAEVIDEEIEHISFLAVKILDNTIDLTITPIPESNKHNNLYRTIGVGVMGLGDYMAKNYWIYEDSQEALNNLFEKIALYTLKASAILAKERGPYKLFKGSKWDQNIYFGEHISSYIKKSLFKNLWIDVNNLINTYGLRNGEITAIAPNTSTSILMGATASVNPTFARFFIEKNQKGAVPRVVKYLKEHSWFYPEFKNISMDIYIKNMSIISKWISQGVSMELLFDLNKNIKAVDIYNILFQAWENKCKSIYYIRTIQKNSNLTSEKKECESCSG
ncbi:ribonucleoside-diphosphate reductase class Ia alpha subunit [Cetobacterium ceti]|uniref:Ribonucleoside-diphosphate reductase n=1 Tax=Cetobacterium ceti TaxID=180163 RepID=A0A1T4QFF6_9FUSO|nr:ribonucleoside-diphosphate reductase subunit alpha [Cetobacterium ceti]SKA02445.1 ribonucleoside-diphosphate reductase class Ia alpha subunit [Cetobacterium ceti]